MEMRVPSRGAARPGDLKRSCLKIDKAAGLGWKPQMKLNEGIELTLLWWMGLGK